MGWKMAVSNQWCETAGHPVGLTSNTSEWCVGCYDRGYYGTSSEKNPKEINRSEFHVWREGS